MSRLEDAEVGTIPAMNALVGIVIVLRNLSKGLIDRGILSEGDLTSITLSALRDCVDSRTATPPNVSIMDFVWALLDYNFEMSPVQGPVNGKSSALLQSHLILKRGKS